MTVFSRHIDSPIGRLLIAADDDGIRALEFPENRHPVKREGEWREGDHPLLDEAARRSPQRRTVDGCEVGRVALLLASPYASAITGEVVHVDAGFHVEGMVFH